MTEEQGASFKGIFQEFILVIGFGWFASQPILRMVT